MDSRTCELYELLKSLLKCHLANRLAILEIISDQGVFSSINDKMSFVRGLIGVALEEKTGRSFYLLLKIVKLCGLSPNLMIDYVVLHGDRTAKQALFAEEDYDEILYARRVLACAGLGDSKDDNEQKETTEHERVYSPTCAHTRKGDTQHGHDGYEWMEAFREVRSGKEPFLCAHFPNYNDQTMGRDGLRFGRSVAGKEGQRS